MSRIQPPQARDVYSTVRDLHWSAKKKAIARRAFDRALHHELEVTIREAKQMAERINQPDELWELERHLTRHRKEIDGKYDYRYSQLTQVFGRLLYEKWLREEEFSGLREDKLKSIRSSAKFLAEDAAA